MTIAPDPSDTPDAWPVVEVTGEFDHPAAMTCRTTSTTRVPMFPSPTRTSRSSIAEIGSS